MSELEDQLEQEGVLDPPDPAMLVEAVDAAMVSLAVHWERTTRIYAVVKIWAHE